MNEPRAEIPEPLNAAEVLITTSSFPKFFMVYPIASVLVTDDKISFTRALCEGLRDWQKAWEVRVDLGEIVVKLKDRTVTYSGTKVHSYLPIKEMNGNLLFIDEQITFSYAGVTVSS